MGPVKKVIFFNEAPFDERRYNRLGIEILQKNGFDVEVWDFTLSLHPDVHRQGEGVYTRFSGLRQFLTKQKAVTAIKKLEPSCFVVSLLACGYGAFDLYRALSSTEVRYATVVVNAVPVLSRIRDPWIILDQVTRLMTGRTYEKLFNAVISRIPFRYIGIRPAAILLAGGEQSIFHNNKYSVNKETTVLWCHTLDYDLYLSEKDKPVPVDTNMGVFLDEYLPFHLDYVRSGSNPPPSGPDSYFPALRRLFDVLERELRVKIVIAAHPSSDYENRAKHPEDYFGGRQIVKGKSLELIKKARFVIAHESTVLNFAVMANKPIVFVTTDEIERNPREARFIHAMAAWLNKTAINADASLHLDWKRELTVDRDAYARYREAHIKKSGSPEKPAWQILADYLKAQ